MVLSGQPHPGFVGRAVALGEVARSTGCRHVLPRVLATTRARHDVIDRVGEPTAVLAAVIVAGEDRTARQRGAPVVRHLHHVAEADDQRVRHRDVGRVQQRAVVFDHVGLVGQHQAGGPPRRHHRERLVGGIEDERAPHEGGPYRSLSTRPAGIGVTATARPGLTTLGAGTIGGSSAHLRAPVDDRGCRTG